MNFGAGTPSKLKGGGVMKTKNIISIVLFVIATMLFAWLIYVVVDTAGFFGVVKNEMNQPLATGEILLSPFVFLACLWMLFATSGFGMIFSISVAVLTKIKAIKICSYIEIAIFSLVAIGTVIVYITI